MSAVVSVIKAHDRCWRVSNEVGYALNSRKSRAGAIRLARQAFPNLPIKIFEQGPMAYGRAELRHVEEIPSI